jgi:sugar phosphate isomerase/epimerase
MTQFAYQLYSSRQFGPLSATLGMLAEIGYDAVEGYGALFTDDEALNDLEAGLAATGLTMPTGHFDLALIEADPSAVIAIAERFSMTSVFAPFLAPEDRPNDAGGWRGFGQKLAEIGKPIADAGLTFGWHNHAFEFHQQPSGEFPMALILDASDHVMLEFDMAWAHIAGQDPAAWLDRYGSRVAAAHIKDIAPTGQKMVEDGWADVGQGIMDWPGLYAKLKALNVPSLVVEHDNPADDRRFASTSLAALRRFDAA